MNRYALLAVFCLGMVHHVFAAPLQLIEGLPPSYTPSQPVTFQVRLPAVTNLGSYNVDLVIESNTGTAGVDYHFDVAATMPSSTNYIFPSATNFVDAANVDSSIRHRITLTDFDFTGVNVVAGSSDRVATVVFQTAPTFTGQLSLFVDADGLVLDTPDVDPTPVSDFDAIHACVAEAMPIELVLVPEPTAVSLLMLGVAGISLRLRSCCRI